MRNKGITLETTHQFLNVLFSGDVHAKRIYSLANATLGVISTASLAVNTIGQGLALARGRLPKHTIKQVDRTADGALIATTIPRERVVMAQTPQGFRYEILKRAFDEACADGFMGTDEASLVERSGGAVAVVMGSPRNLKITTPSDMELAEFYLRTSRTGD